jgi:hypothetical protein
MQGKGKKVEVWSPNGCHLFTLYFLEAPEDVTNSTAKPVERTEPHREQSSNSGSRGNGRSEEQHHSNESPKSESITDPQKRLLFRLLSEKGLEGDKAAEHLKSYFKVNAIKEIGKMNASGYIERLIDEQAHGGNGKGGGRNGSSVQ